ncbi:hypothetical protein [Noviherbaspirillum galbum]|uniref:Uncharacterized protein n=1 Tax=Noviherbaspirillum galbum TaxID=2709383 RepID=A0A6B3SRS4_9BURK|nr:hypothetical protein [Noviherbaspirillum galbum]NEX63351.1 hypothetical protein [Noviherbaspirillum galbum]
MTNIDRIIETLGAAPGALCDDCISRIANVSPRQQVNALAGRLSHAKRIFRQYGLLCCDCGRIKIGNTLFEKLSGGTPASLATPSNGFQPIQPPQTAASIVIPQAAVVSPPTPTASLAQLSRNEPHIAHGVAATPRPLLPSSLVEGRPWHWEGNVQILLGQYLDREGWHIQRFADTESKEAGIDLEAVRNGRHVLFEVKGFPTTVYDHGANRGQAKITSPSSQARQWYSHAMLKMLMLLEQHPDKEIALCFPDFMTYRRLIHGTRTSLHALKVSVYLVTESGEVFAALGGLYRV